MLSTTLHHHTYYLFSGFMQRTPMNIGVWCPTKFGEAGALHKYLQVLNLGKDGKSKNCGNVPPPNCDDRTR